MTDLHPYDGLERRLSHTDADPAAGRALVARLLGVSVSETALYDLSFYSGGIGVFDRLAISVEADADLWERVKRHVDLRTPEEALQDPAWGPEFDEWLCSDPTGFLNSERKPFQDECVADVPVYFQNMSDVNSWVAVWGFCPGRLNYLGFQQG